eukprot:TRINITY_DN1322_c0_g1_i14.p1 TRINITY_DN1322_c0_g1~~TRINITY_DN1322_c0_g1_i14.p1  ORF type:complete len:434 (+),score=71.79 TRINITY_DN1322_c0_g1_i14:992-2293(+)
MLEFISGVDGSGKISVVLLEDLDVYGSKRDHTSDANSRRVAQLLTLLDGLTCSSLVVIATAVSAALLDPALRRPGRLDKEIALGMPSEKERRDILLVHGRKLPFSEDLVKAVAAQTVGYSGADLACLCRSVGSSLAFSGGPPHPENMMSLVQLLLTKIRPSALRGSEVELPSTSWSDIGGYDHVKQRLREAVEWPVKEAETMKRLNVEGTRGVLLYGPPGCSKTTLVRAAARNSGAAFLCLDGASIYSPFLGDAEATIRSAFQKARQASPCVLFLDELDAVVGKRTSNGSSSDGTGVSERVLSTLLNEMDGVAQTVPVLVIAATNRRDMIDSSLLRPGRFDVHLFVGLPDKEARLLILKVHTKNVTLGLDVDLMKVAQKTEGYSGAELENLAREAALTALCEDMGATCVSNRHFETALSHAHSLGRINIPRQC